MAQNIGTISFPHVSPRTHRAPGSWWGFVFFALFTPLVLVLALVVAVQAAYDGRIFPGVSVNGVPIGGLSQAEAARLIEESLRLPPNEQIEIRAAEYVWQLPVGQMGVRPDTEAVLARAYAVRSIGKPAKPVCERRWPMVSVHRLNLWCKKSHRSSHLLLSQWHSSVACWHSPCM